MIEKLKKMWFFITTIVVLLQTVVTFFFLYLKAKDEGGSGVLLGVIFILACIYIFAFIVLALLSAPNKKYSHEAMGRFKRSRNMVKRLINLIMLATSIMLIFNSKSGFVLAPIIMVIFNLFLIILDFKMAEISEKRARKRKKKLREKREAELAHAELNHETYETGNYKNHKKRRFFGDFSKKSKNVQEEN